MNREDYPKLQVHARIGNVIFGPGVSEKTVIEHAIRAAAHWEKSSIDEGWRIDVFALMRENAALKREIERITQEGGSE